MALETNLISSWNYDESSGNATDNKGGKTLTNVNTVTYGLGKIRNASIFNGSDQEFTRSAGTLGFSNNWSFSFLRKFDTAGNHERIFLAITADAKDQIMILKSDLNKLRVVLIGSNRTTYKDYRGDTVMTCDGSTWYHLGVSYDGTNLILYVNNHVETLTKTLDHAVSMSDSSRTINIGGGNYFDGMADTDNMFGATLSGAEFTQLYNGGDGMYFNGTIFVTGLFPVHASFLLNMI